MLLPPALVPTCGPPALISCVPHGDAVSVSSLPFGSPAVILSYSIFSAEPPSLLLLRPLNRVVALSLAVAAALLPVSVDVYL